MSISLQWQCYFSEGSLSGRSVAMIFMPNIKSGLQELAPLTHKYTAGHVLGFRLSAQSLAAEETRLLEMETWNDR